MNEETNNVSIREKASEMAHQCRLRDAPKFDEVGNELAWGVGYIKGFHAGFNAATAQRDEPDIRNAVVWLEERIVTNPQTWSVQDVQAVKDVLDAVATPKSPQRVEVDGLKDEFQCRYCDFSTSSECAMTQHDKLDHGRA